MDGQDGTVEVSRLTMNPKKRDMRLGLYINRKRSRQSRLRHRSNDIMKIVGSVSESLSSIGKWLIPSFGAWSRLGKVLLAASMTCCACGETLTPILQMYSMSSLQSQTQHQRHTGSRKNSRPAPI